MGKKEQLKNGQRKLISMYQETQKDKTTKMSGWVCVHATKYMPQKNKDGNYFIQTTAMATDYEIPRSTVHVALNHIVYSHMSGNWDEMPFIILAPYVETVEINGNPTMVQTQDTYFTPNPDTGLVLPKNTFIVKADKNAKELFNIGDHVSTYKVGNYTPEETEEILQIAAHNNEFEYELFNYNRYSRGELNDPEKADIPEFNEEKDKVAYVKDYCEKRKNAILTQILRRSVVAITMNKMGYNYGTVDDFGAAEIATASGLQSNTGKLAHSSSLEKTIESNGFLLSQLPHLLRSNNFENIYSWLIHDRQGIPFGEDTMRPEIVKKFIINHILQDKMPDFYDMYTELFEDYNESLKGHAKDMQLSEPGYEIKIYGSLKEYNPYLDTVVRRSADRMNQEYKTVFEKLKQNPEFNKFKERLSKFNSGLISEIGRGLEIDLSGLTPEEMALLGLTNNQNGL